MIHDPLEKTHTQDSLLLAIGSTTFVPPIKGINKVRCFCI